jgi:hypothetical protein
MQRKRQIMVTGVIWLGNQCGARPLEEKEVNGDRQTTGLIADRLNQKYTEIAAAWN